MRSHREERAHDNGYPEERERERERGEQSDRMENKWEERGKDLKDEAAVILSLLLSSETLRFQHPSQLRHQIPASKLKLFPFLILSSVKFNSNLPQRALQYVQQTTSPVLGMKYKERRRSMGNESVIKHVSKKDIKRGRETEMENGMLIFFHVCALKCLFIF